MLQRVLIRLCNRPPEPSWTATAACPPARSAASFSFPLSHSHRPSLRPCTHVSLRRSARTWTHPRDRYPRFRRTPHTPLSAHAARAAAAHPVLPPAHECRGRLAAKVVPALAALSKSDSLLLGCSGRFLICVVPGLAEIGGLPGRFGRGGLEESDLVVQRSKEGLGCLAPWNVSFSSLKRLVDSPV